MEYTLNRCKKRTPNNCSRKMFFGKQSLHKNMYAFNGYRKETLNKPSMMRFSTKQELHKKEYKLTVQKGN